MPYLSAHSDIEYFIDIFKRYTKPYLELKDYRQSVQVKIDHSLHVFEIANKLANEFPEHLRFPLQLAALFHDIGRFEQIKIYGTFVDKISCNHGLLGAKVLKKEKFIAHIPKDIQKIVYTAIILHNRFILPTNLPQNYLLATKAVRDADKIDILRVMVENFDNPKENADMINLNVKNEPYYTPEILEQLLAKKPISYSDLKYVNDFRLLQCGWLNDLNFTFSKKYLKKKGYIHEILSGLPQNKEMQKAKDFILAILDEE